MASDPFRQLRVLSHASIQGIKLTDCYRLFYKPSFWIQATQLTRQKIGETAIDRVINEFRSGTFRISNQLPLPPTEECVLFLLYTILHHVYSPCLQSLYKENGSVRHQREVLHKMRHEWRGINWFIVGSLLPGLSNPQRLLDFIQSKIDDHRFLKLLHHVIRSKKILEAKKYNQMVCRLFQLLEDIEMFQLDCFIKRQMKQQETVNTSLHVQPFQHREKMQYARVSRDVVIGLCSSKQSVQAFWEKLNNDLTLAVCGNWKCGHAKDGINFLEYQMKCVQPSNRLMFTVTKTKLVQVASRYGYGDYLNFRPTHRPKLLHLQERDIVMVYNKELERINQRFAYATNQHDIRKLVHLAQASLTRTIANKRRTTSKRVVTNLIYQKLRS